MRTEILRGSFTAVENAVDRIIFAHGYQPANSTRYTYVDGDLLFWRELGETGVLYKGHVVFNALLPTSEKKVSPFFPDEAWIREVERIDRSIKRGGCR
jgi:hypothetical protein